VTLHVPVGNEPIAITSGDLNEDSLTDLAVTNKADGTVVDPAPPSDGLRSRCAWARDPMIGSCGALTARDAHRTFSAR
jgi:hypothetical protein